MLLVGTRKGLWLLAHDDKRGAWTVPDPLFLGQIINHAVADPRDPATLLAGVSAGHLGPTVFRSRDAGKTWTEASRPPAFPEGDKHGRTVSNVFWLTPGHADENGTWYAGGVPQGLFRTEDAGDTWEPVSGWNDHEMWIEWASWPDGTPDGAMLHSINIDPRDASHFYIGLSFGGVFETTDGGLRTRPALLPRASGQPRSAVHAEPLRLLPPRPSGDEVGTRRQQHAGRTRRHRVPRRTARA